MASITAPGLGSGLDVNSIISSLMSLEERPIQIQQQKEAGYYTQLSAVGQLRGAVSAFQSAIDKLTTSTDLATYSALSTDSAKFSASADETATVGSYNIQVTALAEVHKKGSKSFLDADTTTVGAAGDIMTTTVNGSSFDVEIGGKTLSEIATAINDAADNVGITANVLQESPTSYRLILSSNETGTDNAMSLAFEDSVGAPLNDTDLLGMDDAADPQIAVNASILIDNAYTVTRSSNTISDAITGVTLNLKEISAPDNVQLDITRNTSGVYKSVEGFVAAYNTLQQAMDGLSQGALHGDSSISMLERQLQSVLNSEPSGLSGNYENLSALGIAKDREGVLQLDSSKLSAAVADDLDGVIDLFANDDQGYAFKLDSVLDDMLASNGIFDSKEDGLNARIERSQSTIENLQRRMVTIEARYRAQYSALDSLMANMSITSTFLDQQLQSLSNLTSRNK